MNVRKQSGLPTTPPHVGDDELLLDGATGVLHGRSNAGTIVPVTGYKSYVAYVTQSSTDDPVATVMRNDFGVAAVWTRDDIGQFSLTFGAAVLTETKTVVLLSPASPDLVVGKDSDTNLVFVANYQLNTQSEADGTNFFIEVRVYV